jgi:hypothetical protein
MHRLYLQLFGDCLARLHLAHQGMLETYRTICKTRVEKARGAVQHDIFARAHVSDTDASHWHGSFFEYNELALHPVACTLRTSKTNKVYRQLKNPRIQYFVTAPWSFFATNDSQATQCEHPHGGRSFISAASLHAASRLKSPTLTFPARRLTDLSQPRMNIQTRYPGGDPMAYPIRCTLKFASAPDCKYVGVHLILAGDKGR